MVRKIISSILIVIILALWMPIQLISDWVQECMSVQAVENNNITTIDLTGIASGEEANHTHIYEGKYDNTSHWEECWICNKKVNIESHHLTTSGTAGCRASLGYQTQYCTDGCGYSKQLPKVAHPSFSAWGVWESSNSHYRICNVCGDIVSERCTNSQGQQLVCGRTGTCRICGSYHNASHGDIDNGVCNICGVKLADYSIRKEVINEKTTRIYYTITPISGVEIEFDTSRAFANSWDNNLDMWTITLENSYKSGNTIYATVLATANNSASSKFSSCVFWTGGSYRLNGVDQAPSLVRVIAYVKPDNNVPTKNSIASQGNGTVENYNNKGTVTASYTDTFNPSNNMVYMRLIDKDKKTVITDWQAATRSGTTYTKSFDVMAEIREPANIYVEVKDACGNITQLENGAVSMQYIDALAPRLTEGQTSSTTWSKNKEITYTTLDEGVGKVQIAFNNEDDFQVAKQEGDNYSRTYNFIGDVYGSITIPLYMKDGLDNIRTERVTISNIDNTAPTITNVEQTLEENKRKASITVNANDINTTLNKSGSGVVGYAITKTNETPSSFQEENTFEVSKNGTYYLWVKDAVGNISKAETVLVKDLEINIAGSIQWDDLENHYEARKDSVIHLYRKVGDGEEELVSSQNITAGQTSYQFKTEALNDKEEIYTFRIEEDKLNGYKSSYSQNNITNTQMQNIEINIANQLILPQYTSQITMRPLNSFNKLLKNGQAKIVGTVTADSNNINKVGAYDEEVTFQVDSGVEIDEDSIKIYYIDKEGTEEKLKNYTLNNNELKVNFESNKTSHITAGDSLKIELNGTLKELKQYVSRISYSGFLRDYETGEGTNINLGTLTVATNDISEDAGSIVEKQLPEANIQIKKVDSITEEKLTDATFTLYEWDGSDYVEKEIITDVDGDGIYSSKAYRWNPTTEGKYKIEETGVPANHKDAKFSMEYTLDQIKAENYTIEVDYNDPNYMIYYGEEPDDLDRTKGIIENEPYKVKAEITKVDKETGRVIEAEGIFTIYEWNKQTQNYEEYVSYINGNKVIMARQEDKTYLSSEWLYYTPKNEGKYRIIETQAPEGYYPEYSNNNEKKTYDINLLTEIENGTHTNEGTIKIESEEGKGVLENTRVNAELKVSVIDRETKKNIGQADATLEGAEYGLYAKEDIYHADGTSLLYKQDELVMTRKTDKEAKMIFENLECGTYYLKMIEPSEGYVKEETIHEINLDYQGETLEKVVLEKTIDAQVIKQALELNKRKENGEALENAGFSIYLISNLSIVKTDKITKKAENKYILNDEVAKADKRLQGKENEDGTYNLEDLITYYYGRYIGQEENVGTLPGDNEVYYPYDMKEENYVLNYQNKEEGEEIPEIRSNQEGYLKSPDLAYGEYIVVESSVPREQEEVKPFIIKVEENNREEARDLGNVIDKDFKAKVKIYKKDQETNHIILKEKTGYVIRNTETNELMTTKIWNSSLEDYVEYGTIEHPFETEKTGYLITPMELKLGEYILEEVKAPEGYTVNGYEGSSKDGEIEWQREEKVRFSINSNINYYMNSNLEKIIVVNQENKAVVGTIKIKAEGEYLSNVAKDENKEIPYQFIYETRPVAGVKYEVYVKEDIYTQDNQGTLLYEKDQFITELTTDENGKAMIENLPLGRYYIKETETVEGFSKKEEIREVELSYEGQEVPVVFREIPEEKLRQKIEIVIHNKDEETEEKRTGGKYELYTREEIQYSNELGELQTIPANEKLVTLTANEKGNIDINRDLNIDLPRGKYYLKEIEAPTGYVLQEKELEIDTRQEELVEIIHIEKDFYGIKTKLAIKEINEENEITTGSEFEIRRKDTGEVVQSFITEGKEELVRKLEPMVEYVVIETKPIEGYTTAEEVSFMLDEQGEIVIQNGAEKEENTIVIRDYKTRLQVEIKDELTNEYVTGPTWQIIRKTEENEQIVEEIMTEWTSEGKEKQIEKLPIGEYTLREVAIGENTDYVTIKEVEFKIEDTKELQVLEVEQKVSKVRIHLKDIETKEYIEGAVLQIIKRTEENGKVEEKVIREWVTEKEGQLEQTLPVGDYIIREVKVPENSGYTIIEEKRIKVIDMIEEQQVELKQDFTKIKIEIIDEETKEKIDDVEVEIINKETGEVIKLEETEEGYVGKKIPAGDYIIREKTPDGYKEVEDIEMKIENIAEVQTARTENKRLIYDMQVEKELASITIDGKKKLVAKGDMQKIEIQSSKINSVDIRLEYVIRVNNVGETKATIGTIIDNIPEGFKLISTDWEKEGSKAIYNAKKEELEAGKSKEVRIILKWENDASNFGEKKNTAQLQGSTNPYDYEDKNSDNNLGEEITIFSIKTGSNQNSIIIQIMMIGLLMGMFICFLSSMEVLVLKRTK